MILLKNKYKDYNLYFYDSKFFDIGKKVIDKEVKKLKDIKNTKRNYVALIENDGIKYILKEPRNEFRIPQRKIMTIFKNGEALNTLINVTKLIEEEKVLEYVRPFLAITKRKNKMITYSTLILEYSSGVSNRKYLNKFIEKMKEIHSLGYYHGDFNPSNFLIEDNEKIRIIDTQGKRMRFSKFGAHYDMLTMKIGSYSEMKYPYNKDFSYYLALSIKKFKKLKIVKDIKNKKKELRDKGWKI